MKTSKPRAEVRSTTAGREIIASLQEFVDDLKSSAPITVRRYRIELEPGDYPAERVQATRALLNLSQPLFAKFLGVDTTTVRSWEQGTRRPSGTVRRFLDEIHLDPEYWKKRVSRSIVVETDELRRGTKARAKPRRSE